MLESLHFREDPYTILDCVNQSMLTMYSDLKFPEHGQWETINEGCESG